MAWEKVGIGAVESSDGTVVLFENVDEMQELGELDRLAAVGAMSVEDDGSLRCPIEAAVGESVAGDGDNEFGKSIGRWAKIDQVITLNEDASKG